MTFERGCGTRKDNALYIAVETSPFGMPLEYFLLDPVIPWTGGSLRAPMIVCDPHRTNHVIIGIGKEYYPYLSDFAEETRRHGISKRVPLNFDPSQLTPGKSKLLLMHPRGIPLFKHKTHNDCPKNKHEVHECIGDLWSLSTLDDTANKKHQVEVQVAPRSDDVVFASIQTPSVKYRAPLPDDPDREDWMRNPVYLDYSAGICLAFGTFKFQYVSKENKVPKEVADRFATTPFQMEVVPE